VVPAKKLMGMEIVRGLGCHGDRELGQQVAQHEDAALRELVERHEFVMIALGLGGGTGSALALELIRMARAQEAQVIVVCTWPMAFEGSRRAREARETLALLRQEADCVLVFDNHRLAALPDAQTDVRQVFHVLNRHLGAAVQALAQVLCKQGLIQLSFADLRSLFGRYRGCEVLENCWVGQAEAHEGDSESDLIKNLLESPLLADPTVWERVDHGILNLWGGHDLSLRDVQAITEELQKNLPKKLAIAVNANLEERQTGTVRLTLLLAETQIPADPEPAPVTPPITPVKAKKKVPVALHDTQPIKVQVPPRVRLTPRLDRHEELLPQEEMASVAPSGANLKGRSKKYLAKQEELPFEMAHRGRFENSIETLYKGENLDQPTFRRRRLQIRL
jgi:cell division protein FtsZ